MAPPSPPSALPAPRECPQRARCPISARRRLSPQPRRLPIGRNPSGTTSGRPIAAPIYLPSHEASALIGGAAPRGARPPQRFSGGRGGAKRGSGAGSARGGVGSARAGSGSPHGAAADMAGAPRGHLQPAALQDGRLPGCHAPHRPGEGPGMLLGASPC